MIDSHIRTTPRPPRPRPPSHPPSGPMGRHKNEEGSDTTARIMHAAPDPSVDGPLPHGDDPVVRLARQWIALKKHVGDWSSDAAAFVRLARHEIASGRLWIRLRLLAYDVRARVAVGLPSECTPASWSRLCRGRFADGPIVFTPSWPNASCVGMGVVVLAIVGVIALVAGAGGGHGYVDAGVGVDGCPDQTSGTDGGWRHSCRSQWTGELHGTVGECCARWVASCFDV